MLIPCPFLGCGKPLHVFLADGDPSPLVAIGCKGGSLCEAAYNRGAYTFCEDKHLSLVMYRRGCSYCLMSPKIVDPPQIVDPANDWIIGEFVKFQMVNLLRHRASRC